MRRKEREVVDKEEIFEIIDRCDVVHLAMVDEGKPYVVALNFGYERVGDELVLYFHSAGEGKKMDILQKNPSVYFEMDCGHQLVPGTKENPCAYGWKYQSVMGSGEVEFIHDHQEKTRVLNLLVQHGGRIADSFEYPEAMLDRVAIYQVRCSDYTAKRKRDIVDFKKQEK